MPLRETLPPSGSLRALPPPPESPGPVLTSERLGPARTPLRAVPSPSIDAATGALESLELELRRRGHHLEGTAFAWPVRPSPGLARPPSGGRRSNQVAARPSPAISTAASSLVALDDPRRLDFGRTATAASCAAFGPLYSVPASSWPGAPPPPPAIDVDQVWPHHAEVAQRQGAVAGADAGGVEVPIKVSNLTLGGPPPRAFNLPRGGSKVGQLLHRHPGGAAHSAVYLAFGSDGQRRIVDATGRALAASVGWQALMPKQRLGRECDEYVQVSASHAAWRFGQNSDAPYCVAAGQAEAEGEAGVADAAAVGSEGAAVAVATQGGAAVHGHGHGPMPWPCDEVATGAVSEHCGEEEVAQARARTLRCGRHSPTAHPTAPCTSRCKSMGARGPRTPPLERGLIGPGQRTRTRRGIARDSCPSLHYDMFGARDLVDVADAT